MKKFAALLLSVVLVFGVTACTKEDNKENETVQPTSNVESSDTNKSDANKNDDVSAEGLSGEITVSAFESMFYGEMLKNAAELFEAENEGTKINVNISSDMPVVKEVEGEDGEMTVMMQSTMGGSEKYMSELNTQLMSGQGPDIIAADVIPYHQYADSGQIEDLSDVVNSLDGYNKAKYASNIFEATKYKGEQFVLPTNFSFRYAEFNKKYFTDEQVERFSNAKRINIEQILNEDMKAGVGDAKLFSSMGLDGLLFDLIEMNISEFVDFENKKANFTDGRFVEMLNNAKAAVDAGKVQESMDYSEGMVMQGDFGEAAFNMKYYHDLFIYYLAKASDFTIGTSPFTGQPIDESTGIGGVFENNEHKAPVSVNTSFVLNKNSKNKELAKAFLAFLLRDDVQEKLSMFEMPISNVARKAFISKFINDFSYNFELEEFDQELAEKALEEAIAKIDELISEYDTCLISDQIVKDTVNRGIMSYALGDRSAEEAAEEIQNKLTLYLNE